MRPACLTPAGSEWSLDIQASRPPPPSGVKLLVSGLGRDLMVLWRPHGIIGTPWDFVSELPRYACPPPFVRRAAGGRSYDSFKDSQMPRYLISDAHEWINEIPTVPIYIRFPSWLRYGLPMTKYSFELLSLTKFYCIIMINLTMSVAHF